MKTKKNDMSVRELFKRKLDGAEVIPDPSLSAKLMRKLARKEFMRFNPRSFNAYYLGGILAAALTTGIMLLSGNLNSSQIKSLRSSENDKKTTGTEYLDVATGTVIIKESEQKIMESNEYVSLKPQQEKNMTADKRDRLKELIDNNSISLTNINDSYSKNGLFNDSSENSGKLQRRNYSGETIFEPSALNGCVPLKLHFIIKTSSYDSCSWTFGDGGYSDKRNPEWIFDMEGEYKVVLNLYSNGKLQAASSEMITVYPRPQARFEIAPEKAVLPDDEIHFLNYSTNGMKFKWFFGDGSTSDVFEPVHKYAKFSNYNVALVVSSENGCSDSLIVLNAFSGSEYFIDFPNAFIPNPDGPSGGFYSSKSDEVGYVFHPTFSGVTDYQLRIFSKIGILIFESSDVNIGWDGYFKGQLANPGVYIWKVRGSFRNGEPFVKMGDVTLLRN